VEYSDWKDAGSELSRDDGVGGWVRGSVHDPIYIKPEAAIENIRRTDLIFIPITRLGIEDVVESMNVLNKFARIIFMEES
jgi:hypothetical protein